MTGGREKEEEICKSLSHLLLSLSLSLVECEEVNGAVDE